MPSYNTHDDIASSGAGDGEGTIRFLKSRNGVNSIMRTSPYLAASITATLLLATAPVSAGEQDAIDGCIDKLRSVGGPDARSGGEVISSEFSEAATLVMLRDGGGTLWRCLAYSDGTVGELSVSQAAADGGGAMAGSSGHGDSEPGTSTERIRFDRCTTGTEINATLTRGSSTRYLLGAK